MEERYQKLKFNSQGYAILQFGICTFHWDDSKRKYLTRPFSFFVYPRSKITDQTMLFQANCIGFLAGHHFDFNKLFNQAISFARLSEKDTVREQCKYRVMKSLPSERQHTCLSEVHQKQLDEMMERIEDWVYDTTSSNKLTFNIGSYSLKKALSKQVTKVYVGTGIFTEM